LTCLKGRKKGMGGGNSGKGGSGIDEQNGGQKGDSRFQTQRRGIPPRYRQWETTSFGGSTKEFKPTTREETKRGKLKVQGVKKFSGTGRQKMV